MLSTSQEECSHEKPNQLSQHLNLGLLHLQNFKKINVCCLRHSIDSIMFWQLEQENTEVQVKTLSSHSDIGIWYSAQGLETKIWKDTFTWHLNPCKWLRLPLQKFLDWEVGRTASWETLFLFIALTWENSAKENEKLQSLREE